MNPDNQQTEPQEETTAQEPSKALPTETPPTGNTYDTTERETNGVTLELNEAGELAKQTQLENNTNSQCIDDKPGYGKPPKKHQWKPGQHGGGRGPKPAGVYVRVAMNRLMKRAKTRKQLEAIARDKSARPADSLAAIQILRAYDLPDPADIEAILDGSKTLAQLRAEGVNTRVIKKVKERRVPHENGRDWITTREVELTNGGGAELERLLNQTAGSPKETHVLQTENHKERADLDTLSDDDLRQLQAINAKLIPGENSK